MDIKHIRVANCNRRIGGAVRQYCISHVYIDGVYSHDAIEDIDRGLDQRMSEGQIARLKVRERTAIPTGSYRVRMDRYSPSFGRKAYYKAFCRGFVPCLDPVKGYAGILIHRGSNETHTAGCVIVGLNKTVGAVTDSREVFERIYRLMKAAADRGETINYTISRTYEV